MPGAPEEHKLKYYKIEFPPEFRVNVDASKTDSRNSPVYLFMAPLKKLRVATLAPSGIVVRHQFLLQKYDVESVALDDNPDLYFLSASNAYITRQIKLEDFKKLAGANCIKVFVSGENVVPDFKVFDYAFSFEETTGRNFYFPTFVHHLDHFEQLRTGRYDDQVKAWRNSPKSKFCCFVYSARSDPARSLSAGALRRLFIGEAPPLPRQKLAEKLMEYKKVDCPGAVLNNMRRVEWGWENKLDFMSRYKFTVAAERVSTPRYVTEKLPHALLVNSVPIYWGCPRIAEYFNPEAFINCHDYDNFDQVLERVIEVDNDDNLYRKYLQAPPIIENSRLHDCTQEKALERMDEIINSIGTVEPVFTSSSMTRVYLIKGVHWADGVLARVLRRIYGCLLKMKILKTG